MWGAVPSVLNGGVLYRNGPDLSDPGIAHPFDGDGRVDAIFFENGTIRALSRHVMTPHRRMELRAGGKLFRHAFGTKKRALTPLKHSANTSVVFHANALLALCESSFPYELHPTTLETVGPHALWGAIHPGESVCAHTKVLQNGHLVVLCVMRTLLYTRLRFHEIDTCGEVVCTSECKVSGVTLVHDFAVTDSSFVFFCPAFSFDVVGFGAGESAAHSLKLKDERIVAYTLKRGGTEAIPHMGDNFVVTHIENAHDGDHGTIVDVIATQTFDFWNVPVTHSVRLLLSNGECRVLRFNAPEIEFPNIRRSLVGHPNRFCYASSFTKKWMKIDHLTGGVRLFEAVPGALHLEPTFVAAGEKEDEGVIVGVVVVESVPHVAVVHARTLTPLCVAPVPECNVLGLHSAFVYTSAVYHL